MMYRLALIVAPQGAGKTRLLREWMRERSKFSSPAPAWVSLEPGDNDIAIFTDHLLAAFREIDPGLADRLPLKRASRNLPAVEGNGPNSKPDSINGEVLLIDIINALAAFPQELALVLDEYHLIHSPEIHQAVAFFIRYLPENVHLYLASRNEPRLPVAHLRARREMIEIGLDELINTLE